MTEAGQTEGRKRRRRGPACLGLLVALSLALASAAAATPTVTLKVKAIPIPGFPGTGNILGAGAEVETQVTISGTEYGSGFPSPLTGINVYAPVGVKVASTGFATCALAALENKGPQGCPKKSSAGPVGEGLGVTAFGDEEVPEKVSIQSFFAPGGLVFYVDGRSPVSLQIVEKAHWVSANAPFGQELMIEVPLIQTVPGAPDASVLSFKVEVGAAYKKGRRTVSYITNPKRCPKGGFPVKMELQFLSGETVPAFDTVPCPKR